MRAFNLFKYKRCVPSAARLGSAEKPSKSKKQAFCSGPVPYYSVSLALVPMNLFSSVLFTFCSGLSTIVPKLSSESCGAAVDVEPVSPFLASDQRRRL